MIKEDINLINPLGLLGMRNADTLDPGCFGAVMARAGVGKTAIIVQMALNSLGRARNLLHISLKEPIGKINIHYREVFDRQAQQKQWPNVEEIWDELLRHRFIMTFQVEGFSVPKLKERLTDLTAQNIFHPNIIIIDDLPFDEQVRPVLEAIKALSEQTGAPIWYTITTHRHESLAEDGFPMQLSLVQDLFDIAIGLQPRENVVEIRVLKGSASGDDRPEVILDPATMLIKNRP